MQRRLQARERLAARWNGPFPQPGYNLAFLPPNRIPAMAERKRVRRNTLERRCLSKVFKRMFAGAPKGTFKMLEKIKRV
jgi:hypothetical protein